MIASEFNKIHFCSYKWYSIAFHQLSFSPSSKSKPSRAQAFPEPIRPATKPLPLLYIFLLCGKREQPPGLRATGSLCSIVSHSDFVYLDRQSKLFWARHCSSLSALQGGMCKQQPINNNRQDCGRHISVFQSGY